MHALIGDRPLLCALRPHSDTNMIGSAMHGTAQLAWTQQGERALNSGGLSPREMCHGWLNSGRVNHKYSIYDMQPNTDGSLFVIGILLLSLSTGTNYDSPSSLFVPSHDPSHDLCRRRVCRAPAYLWPGLFPFLRSLYSRTFLTAQ